VTLGVSIPSADHGFTGGVVWWANEARKALEKKYPDLRVTVRTARDATEQAGQLRDLVDTNQINALVVFPWESAALTDPVRQVHARGVYVTVVDRGLLDTAGQDAYVAGDNTAFGRVPAEFMARTLGGRGEIVVLRGIETPLDNERMSAFMAVMRQHPGIRIVDTRYANWNRDDAFKAMQDLLARHPRLDAVWAADDDMAAGVLQAVDQARRTDIRLVFGGAGSKGMLRAIKDGTDPRLQADVSYSPKFIYDAIVLTAEARLAGRVLPSRTILPSMLITRENAREFYFPDSPY
jgi:ribose transport system substrate-binding protein